MRLNWQKDTRAGVTWTADVMTRLQVVRRGRVGRGFTWSAYAGAERVGQFDTCEAARSALEEWWNRRRPES
jgi:hypothetical protein